MLDFPPPTLLVLGHTASTASITSRYLRTNSSAVVVDCGSDVHRAFLTLGTAYFDAVLGLSNGDDDFLDEAIEPLIRRSWILDCPLLVIGVSEGQKRRLEETGYDALYVLTKEAPLERLWEELERAAGLERDGALV